MKGFLLAALALGLFANANVRADTETSGNSELPGIEMQAVSFSQWDQELAALKGNIAVVDLWASWCSPCLERFPHMVELHHKYQAQGVRFVSLNFDERGDLESLQWANRFLTRVQAVFPNYHMNENMTEAFERLDLLGLPVVLIYDKQGREAYRLSGDDPNRQFTDKDVEIAVLNLLNQSGATAADQAIGNPR